MELIEMESINVFKRKMPASKVVPICPCRMNPQLDTQNLLIKLTQEGESFLTHTQNQTDPCP